MIILEKVAPWEVQHNMFQNIKESMGATGSPINVCRIDKVDTKTMTVSVYVFNLKKGFANVPFSMPYYNRGTGIIFVPDEQTLGVLGVDAYGQPILLSFIAPSTSENSTVTMRSNLYGEFNFPDLKKGELLISSLSKAMLKLDETGGITLASSLFAFLNLDAQGDYTLDIESGKLQCNGTMTETYTEEYSPEVVFTKGKHKLTAGENDEINIELDYSMKHINSGNFIGFDEKGNIHISGEFYSHKKGVDE